MTKTTYCPECSGRGYIQRSEVIDNGDGTGSGRVWTENCGECNGTGFKTVPITNADRIRAMSDEELATLVRGVIFSKECPSVDSDCEKCFFREPCFGDFELLGKEVEWLKQPAEEGE